MATRAVRTRLVWLLMRLLLRAGTPPLAARALKAALAAATRRGELSILGGVAVQLLLDARTFDPTGAQAYGVLTGTHEVQVQQALVRSLRAGDSVWDVGANVGYMSLAAARLVGPRGRVVAIEPDASCGAAIKTSARLNGLSTVELLPAAAAAQSGTAEVVVVRDRLWTRLASVGDHELAESRTTVRAVALDDLDRPPPRLVKIDVEGGELEVIAGMERLLREERPLVVCEMHGRNAEFCAAMQAAGYEVTNLDGPEPVESANDNVHALCTPMTRRSIT